MPDRRPTMALAAVDGRKSRVDLEKLGKGRPQPGASVYGREMGWLDVQLRVSVAMTRRHSLLSWLETPSVAKGNGVAACPFHQQARPPAFDREQTFGLSEPIRFDA